MRLSETHRAVLLWALRSPILPTRLGGVTATSFPPGPSMMLPQQRDLLPCWGRGMLVLAKMVHGNCALAVHTHTHTHTAAMPVSCPVCSLLPLSTAAPHHNFPADPKLRASLPPCLHSLSEPEAPPPSGHFLEKPWDRRQHSRETRSKHFLSSTFGFTWQVSRFNLAGGRLGYE